MNFKYIFDGGVNKIPNFYSDLFNGIDDYKFHETSVNYFGVPKDIREDENLKKYLSRNAITFKITDSFYNVVDDDLESKIQKIFPKALSDKSVVTPIINQLAKNKSFSFFNDFSSNGDGDNFEIDIKNKLSSIENDLQSKILTDIKGLADTLRQFGNFITEVTSFFTNSKSNNDVLFKQLLFEVVKPNIWDQGTFDLGTQFIFHFRAYDDVYMDVLFPVIFFMLLGTQVILTTGDVADDIINYKVRLPSTTFDIYFGGITDKENFGVIENAFLSSVNIELFHKNIKKLTKEGNGIKEEIIYAPYKADIKVTIGSLQPLNNIKYFNKS